MMLIDDVYKKTDIGTEMTFSFQAHRDQIETLERFAEQLERLDELAEQGLVQITQQHAESHSGERFIDIVRFKRLK